VGACAADGVVEVAELEEGVDEGAAFEVVALEPLVEQVEDREQLLLRCCPAPSCSLSTQLGKCL
jgi:hypothetical protein